MDKKKIIDKFEFWLLAFIIFGLSPALMPYLASEETGKFSIYTIIWIAFGILVSINLYRTRGTTHA